MHAKQGPELLHKAGRQFDSAAESFARLRDRGPQHAGAELCYDAYMDVRVRC
jgi:hypothetical protein